MNQHKTVRVHASSYNKLIRIGDVLRARASKGMAIPVRIELGMVHLLDYAVNLLAKEVKVR